jgi:hypothetical protein
MPGPVGHVANLRPFLIRLLRLAVEHPTSSEWRLHRQWYERSAMGDLLGGDFDLVQKDNPYRYLDKLLAHKTDLFSFLSTTLEDPVRGQIRSPALRPNQHVF